MKHFLFILSLFYFLTLHSISGWGETKSGIQGYVQKNIDESSVVTSLWQNMGFAKARIVSGRTGLQNLKNLILGLELEIKPDWFISQPVIEINNEGMELLSYPILHTDKKFEGRWDSRFQDNQLFPFFLKGPFKNDIELQITTKITGCHPEFGCYTQDPTYLLTLPANEAEATLWYGSLMDHLKQVAFPAEDIGIDFQTEILTDKSFHLRLTFPKNIKNVEIQGKDIVLIDKNNIQDNVFDGILKATNPIQVGDVIPVLLRTSIGCFTLDILIQNTPILPLPTPLRFGFGFLSGFLLFLLSPAWCYWFNPLRISKTAKNFRKETRKIQFLCCWGLALLGIAWISGILPTWYECPVIRIGTFIILIGLFIFPYAKWYILPLLFLILPKPFWNSVESITLSSKIYLLIWWSICTLLPFNIWILSQKYILKFFKSVQTDLSYQLCVRLPYIILMGWIILSGLGLLK